MLVSVFVACCSQVLLKKAADSNYKNWLAQYLNKRVILAYALFSLSAFVSMYVLRFIPLSLAVILESAGYIFTAVLSYTLLKERLNKKQLAGMALIIFGIILFIF